MENNLEEIKKPTREELIAETKILLAKFMLRKEMKESKEMEQEDDKEDKKE
jgi:hypothetical protein